MKYLKFLCLTSKQFLASMNLSIAFSPFFRYSKPEPPPKSGYRSNLFKSIDELLSLNKSKVNQRLSLHLLVISSSFILLSSCGPSFPQTVYGGCSVSGSSIIMELKAKQGKLSGRALHLTKDKRKLWTSLEGTLDSECYFKITEYKGRDTIYGYYEGKFEVLFDFKFYNNFEFCWMNKHKIPKHFYKAKEERNYLDLILEKHVNEQFK